MWIVREFLRTISRKRFGIGPDPATLVERSDARHHMARSLWTRHTLAAMSAKPSWLGSRTVAIAERRGWRVSRASHGAGVTVTLPDTVWNRMLLPLEHRGPVVLYVLTAIYLVAYAVLLIGGESADTVLIVAQASREVITVVFVGVLVAGYMSVRPTFRSEPPGG